MSTNPSRPDDQIAPAISPESRAKTIVEDCYWAIQLLLHSQGRLGGLHLKGGVSSARDFIMTQLKMAAHIAGKPWKMVPVSVSPGRLVGGIDLASTLKKGLPVRLPGLLSEADGGFLVLAMAERQTDFALSSTGAALDLKAVQLERDGLSLVEGSVFDVIALDESEGDEVALKEGLKDRLALTLDCNIIPLSLLETGFEDLDEQYSASRLVFDNFADTVSLADDQRVLLVSTAQAFGLRSLRPVLAAEYVSKLLAFLMGDNCVENHHLERSVRLVLLPKAVQLPAAKPDQKPDETDPDETDPDQVGETPEQQPELEQEAENSSRDDEETDQSQENEKQQKSDPADQLIEAATADLPPEIWAQLRLAIAQQNAARGRKTEGKESKGRGRPAGVKRANGNSADRLDILATIRSAVPWQRLRRMAEKNDAPKRLIVRKDDFRLKRTKSPFRVATLFVVDASGSSAFSRLGEAKGAIELMLSDCYIRRDEVALIAFRGEGADLLLPLTRSVARVRKCLSLLPGGGATPLAAGLELVDILALSVSRKGLHPYIVLLSDGGANCSRAGEKGRAVGQADALVAARTFSLGNHKGVAIDISPRGKKDVREISEVAGLSYLRLPSANAHSLSASIKRGIAASGGF